MTDIISPEAGGVNIQQIANQAIAEAVRYGPEHEAVYRSGKMTREGRARSTPTDEDYTAGLEGRKQEDEQIRARIRERIIKSNWTPEDYAIKAAQGKAGIAHAGYSLQMAREDGPLHQSLSPERELAILALAYKNRAKSDKEGIEEAKSKPAKYTDRDSFFKEWENEQKAFEKTHEMLAQHSSGQFRRLERMLPLLNFQMNIKSRFPRFWR